MLSFRDYLTLGHGRRRKDACVLGFLTVGILRPASCIVIGDLNGRKLKHKVPALSKPNVFLFGSFPLFFFLNRICFVLRVENFSKLFRKNYLV